jgi:transposase
MSELRAPLTDLNSLYIEALRAIVLTQQEELLGHKSEIEHLQLLIAKLRRMLFGRSSEKVRGQIDQLELKLEELETSKAERAAKMESQPVAVVQKPSRQPLPENLPREVQTHIPKHESCPECGGQLRKFSEDVSEVLEYVPASFKVIRHVRPKFSCADCQQVVQAPAPSRPIERGMAGPGLLAHVLTSKYCDHLPLYRQAEIYSRQGVELDRSTLASWVGGTSHLLQPLVEAVRQHVVSAGKVHADDTPVPVLAPGTGKTKIARLWTYVRDDRPAAEPIPPAVWFAYSEDRKGEHPKQHLATFQGILQADGYAGFHHLYEGGQIQEAACWAHVRRKFYDFDQAHASPIAAEAVERIGALYAIEKEIRGKPAEERCTVRQSRARPLLEQFHSWLEKKLASLSRKSELAAAIRYALARWKALLRYLDDGHIEIDNSSAERALRSVALGRKNYLFAGSDAGGQWAAALYTLIGTARLNHLDPEAYLRHVLSKIADHPICRIQDLLPWNVTADIPPLMDPS